MDIRLVGPSYKLDSRPASVQRTVNMYLVPQEPGNERTPWVLQDVPGLAAFSAPPAIAIAIAWLAVATDSSSTATPGSSGSSGFSETRTIYAGVVGYTSETVVWSLDTSGWLTGTVPTLAAAPAGKTGVLFTATASPRSEGTVLLTATVDGNAATPMLRAVASFDDTEGYIVTWSEV